MGRLPAEVRAMTPEETDLLVAGWNEAHRGDGVEAMSLETYDDLVRRYG